ncbi:MAG: NAD(P)-dependent oxidoreductase [Verrucomicrobia bacterium]|nr:MAG: NAD(P)-dependent oxidoreductase [Verrucomicrobiota bacterium]
MERLASMSDPAHKGIGVIGLGIIGRAIAGHLRRKGFSVFVWNRSPQPVPNFVGSPGELVELCNYIQIFVSDDEALLQTVEQLSESLTRRHVVLAHSTVAPDSMRAAAEIVERRRARFVEASFTGSKPAAEKGELVYYVGGADAVLREARPILEASSKEIIHIGEIGQASAIKIATNMITAASVQATAEALALVQALGVPLEKFVEAIRVNASHSGTLAMKLPKMLDRDFEAQFSVKHMLKDMQIANQIALSHYLDLGVTSAARDQLFEQMQWGHGDNDYSVVARKYLQEVGPKSHEEPPPEHPDQESIANEPIIASPESHTEQSKSEDAAAPSSQQPLLAFTGTGGATANETTRLRRGFFKQLLSRLSSGQ